MFPEYNEYLSYIASADAKAAFERIVNEAANSGRFDARRALHGYMKNVTFFEGKHRPYAVVPAKNWIMFYIRTPKRTHPDLTLKDLALIFTEASPAQGNELKAKLFSPADAVKALGLMGVAFDETRIDFQSPDEVSPVATFIEGQVKAVTVNAFERNQVARSKCIAHHGLACSVCRMTFESVYGKIGAGYIHVHHLVSIAAIGREYAVDPVRDLRPVCANCHAMLHTKSPPLSIEELRRNLTMRRSGRA